MIDLSYMNFNLVELMRPLHATKHMNKLSR